MLYSAYNKSAEDGCEGGKDALHGGSTWVRHEADMMLFKTSIRYLQCTAYEKRACIVWEVDCTFCFRVRYSAV